MRIFSTTAISLLVIGEPVLAQSVVASSPTAETAYDTALDRQRTMAALASQLGTQSDAVSGVRKQADWLLVEREWTDAAVAQTPQPPSASNQVAAQGSGGAANNGRTANRPTSTTNAAKSRATATTSIGSYSGSRQRVGSTVINVKTGNVATTAKYGEAVTNVGTRDGGSGSARIDVRAGNVVTDATGGNATTNIGARSGNGTSQVVTGTTITRSTGGSATTNIGNGNGVVSTDFTYNEGGTLTIGASGISRNGRTCIEIFRQTCIVHIYFRRKSDPCAPGYWMSFRKCLLPSDLSHKIRK